MKFGIQLKQSLYTEWKFYYLDYDGLKRYLKEKTAMGYTEDDEAFFVELLEKELEKVYAFKNIKSGELHRRIEFCENSIHSILKNPTSVEENWLEMEDEINRIIAEVNELAKFVRLNYTGFIKIIKKHDKHTSYTLKPLFMVRLNSKPFYKENFEDVLLKLSKLYDYVRNRGIKDYSDQDNKQQSGAQDFIRQTTKYWVHTDNVMEVKLRILKQLPVLIYSKKGDTDAVADPAVTSVYFDNDDYDLYLGRLEKSEGAEAIRIRWYGSETPGEVFIERKTHREDWTGEKSVKERFPIKEKYVNAYLRGEYTMEKAIQKMKDRNVKSEEEIQSLQELSKEIQQSVLEKHLHPTIRTFYNRTAFQLPGDARVRISLDTELCMIREDNIDEDRSGENWRRTDIGTDYPFSSLPDSDICRFPYAILEVKLQTHVGAEPPKWVTDLVNSHLVEAVPKFSKYIHGVSTLMESYVSLLPFWLPQMDKEIRKPPNSNFSLRKIDSSPKLLPLSQDNEENTVCISVREHQNTLEPDEYADEDDLDERESSPLLPANQRNNSFFSFFQYLKPKLHRSPTTSSDQKFLITTSKNKRIAIPVRVEPKVFFANERTFLSWLNFSIVLGSLSLGLLNFGDKIGRISGAIFTVISVLVMFYALFLFQWRAEMIRVRNPGPYDDRIGPVVLVSVLLAAIGVNFYLKFHSI